MSPSAFSKFIFLSLFFTFSAVAANRCDRGPASTVAERTTGNNGFHVGLYIHPKNTTLPSPEGYIPGELYTVTIEGYKTRYTEQTFRGLTLVGVSDKNTSVPVGEFKILEHQRSTIRMSSRCLSAVSEEALYPKTNIEVIWQAPSKVEGCVLFKAMVLEYRDTWYMDDGPLTKKFCPLKGVVDEESLDENEQCCACDEANYELTLTGLWSKDTHPKDFPRVEQLTHFSDVVGASHGREYVMWRYNDIASDGMKELAEWGNTIQYEKELRNEVVCRELCTHVTV